MLWLALVLVVSLTVAVFRGGRVSNLADITLRAWWLLLLGFGMQAVTVLFPTDASWSRTAAVTLILLSYVPLLMLVILNREKPGLWLSGVGVLMNFTVILANQGMPVLEGAAIVAGGFEELGGIDDFKHVPLDETSRLTFLADVIPIRMLGRGQVISLGDVFLAVGLGRFLESELRRPVRWFKRGARGEGGSAAPGSTGT